jgi:amino acid adenylation domain-containing protein
LPIDPEYPQERIKYMLDDSNVSILLGTEECQKKIIVNCQLLMVNCKLLKGRPGLGRHHSSALLNGLPHQRHLAYIIYTSGTTGKPKGVTVEHSGVVNTLLCRKEEYQIKPGVVALQLFSFAFDGFIASFFTPIISGAKNILLSDEDIKDAARIKAAIVIHGVTHMVSVPALYRAILESAGNEELKSLKIITLAGDIILPDLLELTRLKNEHIEISAEYGVTEASVMSTIGRNQETGKRVTIGKPVWNTMVFILARQGGMQCIGAAGELCISGIGVARGYLNRPELTAERFIKNRSDKTNKTNIVYKTGDLARWMDDGSGSN